MLNWSSASWVSFVCIKKSPRRVCSWAVLCWRSWPRSLQNTHTHKSRKIIYHLIVWGDVFRKTSLVLIYWGLNKMGNILQIIASNAFHWTNMFVFHFHWSLFHRVKRNVTMSWISIGSSTTGSVKINGINGDHALWSPYLATGIQWVEDVHSVVF